MTIWNRRARKRDKADGADTGPTANKAGWIRWPGRIVPRPLKAEHRDALSLTLDAFRRDRPTCPDCANAGRKGVLMPVADDPLSRKCSDPGCGLTITLNELAMENAPALHYAPAKRRGYFLRQASTLFIIGCLVLASATLYSGYHRSVWMFVAAIILAMPIFSAVFAMRYRAWQADKGRFYEVSAPLGDFVRDELNSIFASSARRDSS